MDIIKNNLEYFKMNGIQGLTKKIITKTKLKNKKFNEYDAWIYNNEPSNKELKNQLKFVPLQDIKFEIVCNEDERLLRSLNIQTYKNYSITNINNKKIASIIEETQSDYMVFVGDNIELLPFALYEIVQCIENNNVMLIYSDNDKLIDGKRVEPAFKPNFAKDTILSQNYIGDFIVVNTKLLKDNKMLLDNLEECYIYDLILRISEISSNIKHISKVLFHELEAKKEINVQNEKRIIEAHLKRVGLEYDKIEDGKFKGHYKIDYKIHNNPKVSIVIPSKDHIEDLDKLLKSIEKSTYSNYEIVIVENNSDNPETFEYYEKIQKENDRIKIAKFEIDYFNYSLIVNFGVKNSEGEYVILLNNDIEFISNNWIEGMLMYSQREDVGICGVKLYFPDRTIQHAGVTIGIRGLAGHRNREVEEKDYNANDYINIVQDVSAVTAACFMVRKSLYEKVQGFDEKLAVAFNDVDFCLKVREANYLVVYNPFVEAYHYESKSRGEDTQTIEKQQRFEKEYGLFVKKWQKVIENRDPYYNRNYRLDTDLPKIYQYKI